ncbi:hypothetical protein HHX47_DHR5000556 [Lentinula edodes]|nr:hypothetical protein HHX47_DHR5000556 [Lentinula edodes]
MDIDESRNRYKRLSLAGESTLSVVSLHSTSLEICEMVYGEHSTSYDAVERFYEASANGHRKTIVEHTLNVLVFPSIHSDSGTPAARFSHSTESAPPTPGSQIPSSHPIHPSLPIPGTSLTVPSPFHLKLRIITRFSFNEQGRITHHRDFWDVKDVMGLVPGVSLAQWIGTRLTARGLSYASRAWFKTSGVQASSTENDAEIRELENGYGPSSSPAADYAKSTQKAFADSVVRNE